MPDMIEIVEPPIAGMTVMPYGLPLMADAWGSFVVWAAKNKGWLDEFKAETGNDLEGLVGGSPLDAMIDEATGHKAAVFAAWCDWITKTQWGVANQTRETA